MSGSRQRSNNELVKWVREKSDNNAGEEGHSVDRKQEIVGPQCKKLSRNDIFCFVQGTRSVHYGLYNQGATCYLNSVLQVLSMTTEIHDRLESGSKTTDDELKTLFKYLKEATGRTEDITESLEVENVHLQGDAADCLVRILRKISPRASEVFKGERTDAIKCCKGHTINEDIDPFWYLSLSLEDTSDPSTAHSVEKGFERIFRSRVLDGDAVYCNVCGEETKATCESEMVSYPQILSLLIKRFILDNNTKSHFKSNRCVDVPRKLQRNHMKYEVYAVVNHTGSVSGGHYTASVLSHEDGAWYEFDDANVYKIEEQPFAESETFRYAGLFPFHHMGQSCSPEIHSVALKCLQYLSNLFSLYSSVQTHHSKWLFRSSSTAYLLMYREAAKHDQVVSNRDEDAIQIVYPGQTQETMHQRGGQGGEEMHPFLFQRIVINTLVNSFPSYVPTRQVSNVQEDYSLDFPHRCHLCVGPDSRCCITNSVNKVGRIHVSAEQECY
uniref:ubiquitin carboxyl-terminal hydrolase 47-like isoform X2 n=1 Tax=Gasterosteus aculeatus aculeatus TaxID=481459 RepID=UPI001A99E68F|nr:ubiquitin carboxyl-terminal hydrolase 47-like isoform X2 [Gasterosteus aculeatus aculeatus]